MATEYIYAEPEEVTAYRDVHGDTHDTRDAAISVNILNDLSEAMAAYDDYHIAAEVSSCDLAEFMRKHKPLILTLLGER